MWIKYVISENIGLPEGYKQQGLFETKLIVQIVLSDKVANFEQPKCTKKDCHINVHSWISYPLKLDILTK